MKNYHSQSLIFSSFVVFASLYHLVEMVEPNNVIISTVTTIIIRLVFLGPLMQSTHKLVEPDSLNVVFDRISEVHAGLQVTS